MFKKLLFAVVLLCVVNLSAQENNGVINVVGKSVSVVKADQIDISLKIRTVDKFLGKSKDMYDAALKNALNVLNKFKSTDKDIEISPMSFGINYKYVKNERVEDGYYTQSVVNFNLKVLDSYFNLIDQLIRVEKISINSSYYNTSDYEKYVKSTYEDAVKTAQKKAEYMAEAAGVKLGRVILIEDESNSDSGFRQNVPSFYNSVVSINSNADEPAGYITVTRSVRVKYDIKD